jgi:NADPH:quinone reductase-like Zn-dependent oxidoreductase
MKAITCRRYGGPEALNIEELDMPLPKANEVLVRVYATTVTSGDTKMRSAKGAGIFWLPARIAFGFRGLRSLVLGMEFAGQIVEVGSDVNEFGINDMVFGMKIGGANAEYVAISESAVIALKPKTLSYEQAAAVPFGALSALTSLQKFAKVKQGQKILINGASGAVGVFAVQLAKQLGAHVTAVCGTKNVKLVESLGADRVIDYTIADFTKEANAYDAILDTVGNTSFRKCRRLLTPYGRHIHLVPRLSQLMLAIVTAMGLGRRVICPIHMGESRTGLLLIKDLIETGRIRPVVDITFPLQEIRVAHSYVDTGRKRGAVVVLTDHRSATAVHPTSNAG